MMPSWKQFLKEGILTNYRNEKEEMKLTMNNFKNTFEIVLCKLIKERIPFWFDCQGTGGKMSGVTRIGYLMNETINNQAFGGYILEVDDPENENKVRNLISNQVLSNIIIEKPGRLYVGRTNYSDLTKAADLDTITVVVKAFKSFYKDKDYSSREISGNKYEAKVKIDFLCDMNNVNNLIDYVF